MEKTNKRAYVYAVIIFLIYALIFVVGMIGLFTEALNGMIGSMGFTSKLADASVAEGNAAYAKIISMMLVAMTPSVLLYLGAKSPFYFRWSLRLLFFVLGTAGLIALAVVYNSVCSRYTNITDELGDTFGLKLSIAIGVVGFVVLYLISIIPIKTEYIKFAPLRVVIRFCKTDIFCVVATVLFTVFLFPLYVIIVGIVSVILFFAMVFIFLALLKGGSGTSQTKYTVTKNGVKYILTPTSYVVDRYAETYTDQFGNYWLTKDGGKSFYPHNN